MKNSFLPTLLLLLIFISCKKNKDINTTNDDFPFIVYESLFGCSNYQSFDIAPDGHFNHILKFNDYFVFGASDHLVVKSDIDESILLDEKIWVNRIIEKENY